MGFQEDDGDAAADSSRKKKEREAFAAVLVAFKAAGELTWRKRQLLVLLRKELRISANRAEAEELRVARQDYPLEDSVLVGGLGSDTESEHSSSSSSDLREPPPRRKDRHRHSSGSKSAPHDYSHAEFKRPAEFQEEQEDQHPAKRVRLSVNVPRQVRVEVNGNSIRNKKSESVQQLANGLNDSSSATTRPARKSSKLSWDRNGILKTDPKIIPEGKEDRYDETQFESHFEPNKQSHISSKANGGSTPSHCSHKDRREFKQGLCRECHDKTAVGRPSQSSSRRQSSENVRVHHSLPPPSRGRGKGRARGHRAHSLKRMPRREKDQTNVLQQNDRDNYDNANEVVYLEKDSVGDYDGPSAYNEVPAGYNDGPLEDLPPEEKDDLNGSENAFDDDLEQDDAPLVLEISSFQGLPTESDLRTPKTPAEAAMMKSRLEEERARIKAQLAGMQGISDDEDEEEAPISSSVSREGHYSDVETCPTTSVGGGE